MTEKSKAPVTPPELNKRALFSPHSIALITMWLFATVSLVVMLFSRVRNIGQFRVEPYILQVAYVLTLFWYLVRTGPPVKQLPDLSPLLLPKLTNTCHCRSFTFSGRILWSGHCINAANARDNMDSDCLAS